MRYEPQPEGQEGVGVSVSTKFSLIDHSIVKQGGHHLEYALRCLKQASSHGYETVLGTSKTFSGAQNIHEAVVVPAFTHTFWQNMQPSARKFHPRLMYRKFKRNFVANSKRQILKAYYDWLFSKGGLDYRRSGDVSGIRDDLVGLLDSDLTQFKTGWKTILLHKIYAKLGSKLTEFNAIGRLAIQRIRSALNNNKITRSLLKFFYRFVFMTIFGLIKWIVLLAVGIVLLPVFILYMFLSRPEDKRVLFRKELKAFIINARLKAGDYIFIPTLGELELLAAADLCVRWPQARKLKWRFVFRRNIFHGRPKTYAKQSDQVGLRRARLAFRRAREEFNQVDVQFLTDTDGLTHQYNLLGAQTFHTGCIPVPDLPLRGDVHRPLKDKVVVTYLGDARDEKNFGLLPGTLNHFHTAMQGQQKARFVLQSNFNQEPGEPKSAKARLELSAMSETYCTLAGGPFTSEQYGDILTNADVLLIPYDADQYATRSSGVMAEALAMAKPMVTTGGSWMATIMEPARQAYLAGLDRGLSQSRLGRQLHQQVFEAAKGRATHGEVLRNVNINAAATHIFSGVSVPSVSGKDFLCLRFTFLDAMGGPTGELTEIVQVERNFIRLLTRVPAGTVSYTLNIFTLDPESSVVPEMVVVTELYLAASVPCSFLGTIAAQTEFSLAYGLADVVDHIETYRDHAARVTEVWRDYHSASNLITQVVDFDKALPQPLAFMEQAALEAGLSVLEQISVVKSIKIAVGA